MNNRLKNIIQTIVFISIGTFLLLLVYKNFDFTFFLKELKTLKYSWFILVIAIGLISHISRALRWQMLLDTDGDKTRFSNTLMAVFNGYFSNMVFPRLGEITRCSIVSKYDKISFSKVLGTMITERIIDLISFVLLILLAICSQYKYISLFFEEKGYLFQDKLNSFTAINLIVLISALFTITILIYKIPKDKINKFKFTKKINSFLKNITQGVVSILKIRKIGLFVFYSIIIWVSYFLMLYLSFFAFQGFETLNWGSGFIIFIAGGLGMLIPAPNGIGAYHFMTTEALLIFGICYEKAAGFALITHGIQTLSLIILGLVSFIIIPIINKSKKSVKI